MATITKLYPILKKIGLDDQKSQEFIEIIEQSYISRIEHEINKLACLRQRLFNLHVVGAIHELPLPD